MDNRDSGTQHKLRMPSELKQKLIDSASKNNRSLNAEISLRLDDSFKESVGGIGANVPPALMSMTHYENLFEALNRVVQALTKTELELSELKKAINK